MRILLSSNAPHSNSGYGVQVKSLLPRLSALEVVGGAENIAVFAWFGVQGGLSSYGPHVVYPGFAHPYGTDIIGKHARHFGADVVITLIDAWTQHDVGNRVKPAKWLPWLPVDTEPVSPDVLEALETAHLPIVYSRFGERMLKQAGVPCAYVPHGVEPDTFKPLERETVAAFRRAVFGEARHVTVMVAANKGFDRKAFQINLRAWAGFAAAHEGAVLYIHTDPTTQAQGTDLLALVRSLGIEQRVLFPDRYTYTLGFPAEYMALLYNAADVLLAASMTEGFGIPIIEAQACGTPVVVTNFASMPELVRAGAAATVADLFWADGLRSWWAWPSMESIRGHLEAVGFIKQRRPKYLATLSGMIHAEFSWDVIVEQHWKPVLEGVSDGN